MTEFIYSIDVSLFHFLNDTISNRLFDKFFLIITDVKNWYIAYIILWFICFFKGGRIGKIASLSSIVLIALSDQFSSALLKNTIQRIRPCHVLDNVNLLVSCKNSYSFPSSHAVNNFAIAVFFSRIFPKYKWILLITATLVAISRPYIGIHYPSDAIGGAIIGSVIGYLFSLAAEKINNYFQDKKLTSV
ncbi:MAG: phosphatase PAP2 family protein [Melioribacteraceae bacterium]|nr:phosphatase PAP2 family protein [Melioribacteraceae bacterium]